MSSTNLASVRLDLFSDRPPITVPLTVIHITKLTREVVEDFLDKASGFIGFAVSYEKGKAKQLAFAAGDTILLVQLGGGSHLPHRSARVLSSLFEVTLLGFWLDRAAIHIRLELNISILGVDLQFNPNESRSSLVPISNVLQKCGALNRTKFADAFLSEKHSKSQPHSLVKRAWAAWMTLETSGKEINVAKRIDMERISSAVCLIKPPPLKCLTCGGGNSCSIFKYWLKPFLTPID